MYQPFIVTIAATLLCISPASAQTIQQIEAKARSAPANRAKFPSVTRLYQFSGVLSTANGDNAGLGTSVHCTNFASNAAQVRFILRGSSGDVLHDQSYGFAAKANGTYSTKYTVVFTDYFVAPVAVSQTNVAPGSIVVASDESELLCSAFVVNAAAATLEGAALPGRRFFPMPDSEE